MVEMIGGEMSSEINAEVPALKVRQWLEAWNDITFKPEHRQARPKEHFYLFTLPASMLRRLAGISRRSTDVVAPRSEDIGIQRGHDRERSDEIRRYVDGGYPWSALSAAKRNDPTNDSLRRPGWLPTAIVVNILEPGEIRRGGQLASADAITISDGPEGMATIQLPNLDGESSSVLPIEVIDGQHRLYAFEGDDAQGMDYDLPVVAFHGLDISWQAYLFWTINIKPKKINPSLAFDLYPLLREQNWLESGDLVLVYRESRAQELTEMLWSIPQSPWYKRINMLGGDRKSNGPVSQSAFIRSLTASMVKSWRSHKGVGGLFGGTPDGGIDGLEWSRVQQSAFLLTAWQLMAQKVAESTEPWATDLNADSSELGVDVPGTAQISPAFAGPNTLLATDQGVRGFQYVINDLCYVRRDDLELRNWRDNTESVDVTPEAVLESADGLRGEAVYDFVSRVCDHLATFDWRSSSAQSISPLERRNRSVYRGSSGYKLLRSALIEHLRRHADEDIAVAALFLEV